MRTALVTLLCLLVLAPAAEAEKLKVRLGSVSFGGWYSSRPFYYPYYYPLIWDPWIHHPGFLYGFPYDGDKGEVRLQAEKTAEVYIDGAYAGTAEKLKSMWLEPGAYTLTVQAPGRPSYERRVYVLTGKSLRIRP